jgi:hypothetical protein
MKLQTHVFILDLGVTMNTSLFKVFFFFAHVWTFPVIGVTSLYYGAISDITSSF